MILVLFGLLSYYLIFTSLNLKQKARKENFKVQGVSLLICAKNELENLKEHLPFWLDQEGVNFEVILVNDASTDVSMEWLDEQSKVHSQLKVHHLNEHSQEALKGKRYALLQGIKAASFEYLVLSDADCKPSSKYWLKKMAAMFDKNTEIVLGYGPYTTYSNVLGSWIDYETTLTALMYLSIARIGFPYMGVGRNIAYKKEVIGEAMLLKSNLSIGGDDDLLVSLIANNKNTKINIEQETFVYSKAPSNFKDWWHQKNRHYSTAKHYSLLKLLLVGGFGAFNVLFYILLLAMLLTHYPIFSIITIYLFKQLIFILINWYNFKYLKVTSNLLFIVCFDWIYWIMFLGMHLKALTKKNGWSSK